ncbi:MAG: DUF1830 domain-containing protein [Waterburya sp.]
MPPTYSATAQVTSEMLYCYTNSTPKMQLVRLLDNNGCTYEKLVFPQQRILLETIPEGRLEVYLEREGKQVLGEILSCQDLPASQPQKELAEMKSF